MQKELMELGGSVPGSFTLRQGRNPMGCYRTGVKVASVGRSISCREHNFFTVSGADRLRRNPTGCSRTRVEAVQNGSWPDGPRLGAPSPETT
jgi:hypothetical protein